MRYFQEEEFSDFSKMDEGFLEFLDELRELYGKPIHLNSTYRSPDHPIEAKKEKPGAHTEGLAADIHCNNSHDRALLIDIAKRLGCQRFGVAKTFLHLDLSESRPSPRVWLY